jgi:potassium/chloride transporter 4/5/6
MSEAGNAKPANSANSILDSSGGANATSYGTTADPEAALVAAQTTHRSSVASHASAENQQGDSNYSHDLYLYTDDIAERPKVSSMLKTMVNYSATISSAPADPDSKAKPKNAGMGTLIGVYLPCFQNIVGVLLFIRMSWIVGTAGILQGFCVVFMCCCVTFLTSISMSAVATNGVIPAGGSYYMISRALGPEFGGAVGILFYLGTTVAGSMYIIGEFAVEVDP